MLPDGFAYEKVQPVKLTRFQLMLLNNKRWVTITLYLFAALMTLLSAIDLLFLGGNFRQNEYFIWALRICSMFFLVYVCTVFRVLEFTKVRENTLVRTVNGGLLKPGEYYRLAQKARLFFGSPYVLADEFETRSSAPVVYQFGGDRALLTVAVEFQVVEIGKFFEKMVNAEFDTRELIRFELTDLAQKVSRECSPFSTNSIEERGRKLERVLYSETMRITHLFHDNYGLEVELLGFDYKLILPS